MRSGACAVALAAAAFCVLSPPAARAGEAPQASPAPAPSPSATPAPHRIRFALSSTASYVNQQFAGPGTAPPEAGAFSGGQPIAPGTPYDLWSSSPNVTGYGVNHSVVVTPSYALSRQYDLSARLGFGSISGNANVAAYWGDQTLPTLNPHLGKRPAPVAFPCANGEDALAGTGFAILGVSLSRFDGALRAQAGWFDLAQSEPFVVNQPAQTNTPIAFTEPLPEGIGDGPEILPAFRGLRAPLPLYGVDLVARPRDGLGIELTDAELPEPPGTHARILSASVLAERSGGVTLAAQLARVATGGAPVGTTVLFGSNPATMPSDQGPLPTSTLGGQRMTIGGIRAEAPLGAHLDAQARLGWSCYAAQDVARPQAGCTPGRFSAARLRRTAGSFEVALEALRMDATYAPMILPYGIVENVWSPAYSWPGTWLKGNYQLVDDSTMGPNRQGTRLSTRFTAGRIEARLAYGVLHQIQPYDATTAYRQGFVEGFYLPQLDARGTLGDERHFALALAAQPRFARLQLDLTDITLARRGSAGHPEDAVALDDLVATLTLSRRLGTHLVGTAGAGRNAIGGAFDAAGRNVDLTERVVFGSLQWSPSAHLGYAIQYRLYSVDGMATRIGAGAFVSPAYHGPQLIVEQRVQL
jgi:hypothetical protein